MAEPAVHPHRHRAQAAEGTHRRALFALIAAIALAVLIGLIVLWPGKQHVAGIGSQRAHGIVTATRADPYRPTTTCTITVTVLIDSGVDKGLTTELTFVKGATDPQLSVGENIRMGRQASGSQAVVYAFADIDRKQPMLALTVVFIIVVLLVGRLQGLAAMFGLAVAGLGLVLFVIPALVAGKPPTAVALVGGAAIAIVVLPLSHGISVRTGAALIGTLSGMLVAAVLSSLTVSGLHFTGTSSDEAATLKLLGSQSSVSGLLLCGAVIGALGVINDVTVTQASAVFEISAADPRLHRRQLFGSAMRIGRDHIASTVYSLALAYAGSTLPLLLLFAITGQSVGDVLTSDALGPAIVAALIGSIALVAVVPLTTAIASWFAYRQPDDVQRT